MDWETPLGEKKSQQDDFTDLVKQLKEAQVEWQLSFGFFNQVTEPDLVDYAIHRMEAAERHFMYLWKEAQKHNLKVQSDLAVPWGDIQD